MTTELRELLTLAAQAAGYHIEWGDWRDCGGWTDYRKIPGGYWNPHVNDGDCARMCATLGIDSIWLDAYVRCEFDDIDADIRERFRDRDDRQHFAQLIGYSHSGYGSLSYATDRVYEAAIKRYEARKDSGDAGRVREDPNKGR